jgi:dTDP-4-dehydrorhamnose reductase
MSGQLKVLIVGGSGFVGSSLTKALLKKFQVFSTYHTSYTPVKGAHYLALPQLSEKDRCERFIRSIEPDIVIYCLGSNIEAEAEKDPKKAQHAHSGGITHLIHATEMCKGKFIYISSDYIFSGIEGNFSEEDSGIPYSQLGKAKAGAESLVRSRSLNHLIIRCAPLLGRGTLDHPSWLDQIREQIIHSKKVRMPSHNIHNPVHVSFLADVIERAVEKDLRNRTLHVGGLNRISLYDFAKQFVKAIGLSPDLVELSDPASHATPSDYSLNFTETLKSVEAKPLLLQQSFDLLK